MFFDIELGFKAWIVQTAAGPYTITNERLLIVNQTVGAADTVNLPASILASASGIRRVITVLDGKEDAATHNITVTPNGSDKIAGSATYVINANGGSVTLVDNGDGDWGILSGAVAQGNNTTTGLFPTALRLMEFKNADGTTLAASPTSGKFGLSITLATSEALTGETSNNNSKTDDAIVEYVLPSYYVPGSNLTVTVNAAINTAGSPTYAAKTVQIKAYTVSNAGVQSADIGPGSASAITVAGADVPFTITGTTLVAGSRLVFELETILHDTGAVACNTVINSVRVS